MLTQTRSKTRPTGRQGGHRGWAAALALLAASLVTGLAGPSRAAPVRTGHLELELVTGGPATPGGKVPDDR